MQLRRSLATTSLALALAAPALTACGFDYATDRTYTPAVGTNDRAGTVDVLSAVVVATEDGSGTFIASLSNNSTSESSTLTEITGGEGIEVAEFEPVEVGADALVNLAEPAQEIEVTGDFDQGDFVTLTLEFEDGQTTELDMPVVPNAGDFADLDGPAPAPTEEPEPEIVTEH